MKNIYKTILTLLILFCLIIITASYYFIKVSKSNKFTSNSQIQATSTPIQNLKKPIETMSSVISENNNELASSIYQESQLDNTEKELLDNFFWPKLKPFKQGDKEREIYLVDCQVTNDALGVNIIGIPTVIPNEKNVATKAMQELMAKHLGGFPTKEEISNYAKINNRTYKNTNSGINGIRLSADGKAIVNFYDSVAAYGGGSSRVGCMGVSTRYTLMQFPTIRNVTMCIDKYDDCAMDFQP